MIKTDTNQHERVGNSLLATMEPFIKLIIKKAANTPEIIGQIAEAFIDNPSFCTPTVALVRPKQQKNTDRKGKNEDCCKKFVEVEMNLDPVAVWHQSKIDKIQSTNICDDVIDGTIA